MSVTLHVKGGDRTETQGMVLWTFKSILMTLASFGELLAGSLFLQFTFNEILNLVDFLLLLVQEVHDDAHGGLLQTNTFNLVLQPVLHVAQSQGGMDEDHYGKNNSN